jgi:predicted GNAT family acetyltransferase
LPRYPLPGVVRVRVIENNREACRYELYESGDLAGFVQYSMSENEIWVHYTQLKRRYRSEEIIEELLVHILDDVHRRRLAIMPFCRAMRTLMDEKTEYAHLVPELWRQRFLGQGNAKRQPMDCVRFTGSPKRPSTARQSYTVPVPLSVSRGQSAGTPKPAADPSINGAPGPLPAT